MTETDFCTLFFRSVVDTVYSIRDQVSLLCNQNKEMFRMLEDEISARKRLEAYVRANVVNNNSNSVSNNNHANNVYDGKH